MSPQDSSNPAQDAVTLTAEMVETMANAVLDGSDVGKTLSDWLKTKKPALIGMGVGAVKTVFAAIRDANGDGQAIYQAKLAYVNTLPWDLVITVQKDSADVLVQHADARVRFATIFDTVGELAMRLAPKAFDVLFSVI